MSRLLQRLIGLVICVVAVAASRAFAQDWSDFATVSMTNATTPKLTSNRLCYTDGRDMLCDGAAGLLTTSGTLFISTISATNIYGSTASLTTLYVGGVAVTGGGASGDRITSGTVSAIANTSGGYISLTTGATTWGYLGSSATYLPIVNGNIVSSALVSTTNVSLTVSEYLSGNVSSIAGGGGNYIVSATTSVSASNAGSGSIKFAAGGNLAMTISGSYVGIGTAFPNTKLDVAGTVSATDISADPTAGTVGTYWLRFKNTNTYASSLCYLNTSGYNYIGACTSLNKWKTNQQPLSIGLNELMKLKPVEFDWTKDHGGFHDLGFIAEQVQESVPLLAEYSNGELISVKYRQMTSLLTKAVQELKVNTDEAEARLQRDIAALKADNDYLRKQLQQQLQAQQRQIDELKAARK